jgi:60 kDa SS-A/Ro ribonucleoprotein
VIQRGSAPRFSNGFSIADPSDAGMLDVVGFDTAAPQLMADFAAGRL